MTKALVEFMRHLNRSSSMRPVWTFWFVACGVVPLATARWIGPGTAFTVLTITAGAMVFAASRRDDRIDAAQLKADMGHVVTTVDTQREGLEARIQVLTEALLAAGVRVPRER